MKKKIRWPLLAGVLVVLSLMPCHADSGRSTISDLEQELSSIDAELHQLAAFTLRHGIGSVGYRSQIHKQPQNPEWIRIELEKEVDIDQIILVPTLYIVPQTGYLAEGFPEAFRILTGTGKTTNVVATFSTEDHVIPRIAPLAVSFPPVKASWIAVEATLLSQGIWDKRFSLQLSEIMVFSKNDNVALNKPIILPDSAVRPIAAHHKKYLVDGFTPYLMDAASEKESKTKLLRIHDMNSRPYLTIDLQATHPINQINLHTANLEYSVPMSQFSNRAVPRHIRILGANRPDFSDSTLLCAHQQESLYDNGPIIILRFPQQECRYIRVEILDPRPIVSLTPKHNYIAFSEIEVLSQGKNIALHAPITASTNFTATASKLSLITDGLNYYGEILPIRTWMNQLSRRHDLEKKRPAIVSELNQLYAAQKINLRRTQITILILLIAIAFIILLEQLIRTRLAARMRERFAADLHDELGANLHTIGLLSDLAEKNKNTPEKLSTYHQRIRAVTERSGIAVRNCTDMLSAKGLHQKLVADMQRAAQRILPGREHTISILGEEYLETLRQRSRFDLFMFYKECLVNISRHSEATQLSTQLEVTPQEIKLTITDNGRGLPQTKGNGMPSSLKRRARLLGAKIYVEIPSAGGTCIHLHLRTPKWKRLKT